MDDALLVRGVERFGDLTRGLQCVLDWKGTGLQPICQRGALDELEDQALEPLGVFHPVDGGDVLVVERRQKFGFALEPGQTLGISQERFREDLDGDIALQSGIACPIDLSHAARSDERDDFVGPETRPDGQRHVLW